MDVLEGTGGKELVIIVSLLGNENVPEEMS